MNTLNIIIFMMIIFTIRNKSQAFEERGVPPACLTEDLCPNKISKECRDLVANITCVDVESRDFSKNGVVNCCLDILCDNKIVDCLDSTLAVELQKEEVCNNIAKDELSGRAFQAWQFCLQRL